MKWCVADGIIYTMFNKKENIVKANEIPYDEMAQWCIGVDYGTQNATVFLLMGKTYDGVIYVCKEYYYSGRRETEEQGTADVQKTDLEYTEDMRKFIGDHYEFTGKTYREIPIIIDPSAASFKLSLRRYHMRTKNGDNSVMDGIRVVSSLMGERRLIVSDECEETIASIYSYVWDEKAQMKGIDRPLKNDTDHACLSGETLINTTEGYKKIQELVGTEGCVNTIDPNTGEKCIKKYSNVQMTCADTEIYELELENGEVIKLTGNHPLLTKRGWVKVENLTQNDEILTLDSAIKIKSVKKTGKATVYNMYVEDVNCYAITKSNIISHNCDAARYGCMFFEDKSLKYNKMANMGW